MLLSAFVLIFHGRPTFTVALDGNFTHATNNRHRDTEDNAASESAPSPDQDSEDYRDPRLFHPNTSFISEETLREVERRVEANGKNPTAAASTIPEDILHQCHESFKAAKENSAKSSKQRFTNTGLMALVCRHDCVLFLANITSAGEKQFLAIALIEEFFKHIPSNATVGILYNIGCQLHASCLKYGHLGENLKRIIWAVAVFHAFGHHWACQLVYHPQKRKGFGKTDGEGSERFWSSISSFVSPLRMAGVSRPPLAVFHADGLISTIDVFSFLMTRSITATQRSPPTSAHGTSKNSSRSRPTAWWLGRNSQLSHTMRNTCDSSGLTRNLPRPNLIHVSDYF